MSDRVIELMDDMHLSSQADFMEYYDAMQNNNISIASNILNNNPDLKNQIMNSDNINILLNETYRRELIPKIDIDYFLEGLLSVYQKMIDYTKVVGEWNANTQYNVHNLVYYNGKAYYSYSNTTPPIGTLPTDTTYWKEYDIKGAKGYGGINLNFKFNWANNQDYKIGDVVIYQNKMWYAIADNSNEAPNLNHYPWVVISMPKLPAKTPIQKSTPTGYDIGDFWFQITQGDEVIVTTWGIRQPEPTPRFASAAFSIGNNIYIAGGINANFERTNILECFDTTLGTWSVKAPMTISRARAAGFSINDNGYCVGGTDENGNILQINEEYNSTNNSWTEKKQYPINIISNGVADNNNGYIIGGETDNDVLITDSYMYDPIQDEWTLFTQKPTATKGHTVAINNGKIYAVGGINSSNNTLNINEVYDINAKNWEQKEGLKIPRSYSASFVQLDMLYVIGGLNSNWYSMDTNEKYDIANDVWITDMPMNYSRSSLNALNVGTKAFAIGGIDFANSNIKGYNEQYNADDIISDFEMVIDTNLDTTGSKKISIPMIENGNYNYWVDWGDGLTSTKITSYDDPQASHTYQNDGEYVVKLMGTLDTLQFTGNIATDLKSVTKCIINFSNIENMFKDCINLASVCDGIFDQSLSITNANNLFENCSSLKTIPLGLFDNNTSITSFNSCFKNSGLSSIPVGLFNSNNIATTFSGTFQNCENIVSIPSGLFSNNNNVIDFSYIFSGCTNLGSIPDNLFYNNPLVTTYESAFNGCNKITTLPGNLFGMANVSVSNYSNIFANCTSLSTIPNGLFKGAINATNYDNTFLNTLITIIPDNCFNGTSASISNVFNIETLSSLGDNSLNGLNIPSGFLSGASLLEYIGNNIFDSQVTNLNNMFNGCVSLLTLGNIDMSNISSMNSNTFGQCTSLTNITGFMDRDTMTIPTIKINFDISGCTNLTHESLINIINSLVPMTAATIKTITLSDNSLNELTPVEKMEIINKYWEISNYNPTSELNEDVAKDIVQKIYGDSETNAQNYLTTSLYYYVELIQNSNVIKLYAVSKETGIIYVSNNVPENEYHIYASNSEQQGEYYYVPKGDTGDINGNLLKENIKQIYLNSNKNYTNFNIGQNTDNSQLKIPNTGLEQIQNAEDLFNYNDEDIGITNIVINGDFVPTNMNYMFKNLAQLVSISIKNINTSNLSTILGMFDGCTSLLNVDFLSELNVSKVKDMTRLFASTPINDWNFLSNWDTSNVINTTEMFNSCKNLKTIPNINMINVSNSSGMFQGSGLINITPNIIGTKIADASYMFANCVDLDLDGIQDFTQIFGHNDALLDVSNLFTGCTNLTTVGSHNVFYLDESGDIPSYEIDETKLNNQLFTYCPNIINMQSIFESCENLGTNNSNAGIPMGVFYHCPKLQNISYAFKSCNNIEVPQGIETLVDGILFAQNYDLINVSHLFEDASVGLLVENTYNPVPNLLFPVSTKITDASYMFANCKMNNAVGYETLPFIYNSKVLTNIEGMFMGQTFNKDISGQYNMVKPEYSWDNLENIVPNLTNCSNIFSGNTNMTGNAMPMINSLQNITTLNNYSQAFKNCTKLSDYNNIPEAWK